MCGIAGIVSKNGENVVPLVGTMLRCMINRGPDGAGLAANGRVVKSNSIGALQSKFQGVSGSTAIGHTRLAIVGGTCGAQPFTSCDGRFVVEHNGEIYNYKMLRQKLEKRRHKLATSTDSEVIVHLLEDHAKQRGLLSAIKRTVADLDGVYAIAIKDEKTGHVALVRDRIGVRQLYYSDSGGFAAFASERKALWKIGISEPTRRVLPGSALVISPDGSLQTYQVAESIPKVKISHRTMKSAIEAYGIALKASMKKRTQDFKRIGIIFSGGIDSVLVAKLAAKMVPDVICYTCGIRDSSDVKSAREIADKLNLPLKVCEFTQEEVEQLIPEVINVIEDSNAGQVEVALPIYGAVRLAHRDGIRVMLTGQGADELYGGYSWYAKVTEKEGYKKLRSHMVQDLLLLYKETLEREDKITMEHSIELREPFLDPKVIRVALGTELRLNVRGGRDTFGKHVHRRLAQRLGIPKEIAYRIKEAAQHGSGMHKTLDAIARAHGFDESTISPSYLEALSTRERVGSSQRYGYLYGDEKIWIVEPHVQLYLDSISRRLPQPQILAEAKALRKSAA